MTTLLNLLSAIDAATLHRRLKWEPLDVDAIRSQLNNGSILISKDKASDNLSSDSFHVIVSDANGLTVDQGFFTSQNVEFQTVNRIFTEARKTISNSVLPENDSGTPAELTIPFVTHRRQAVPNGSIRRAFRSISRIRAVGCHGLSYRTTSRSRRLPRPLLCPADESPHRTWRLAISDRAGDESFRRTRTMPTKRRSAPRHGKSARFICRRTTCRELGATIA